MSTKRPDPAVGSTPERSRVPGRGWITGRSLALLTLALATLAIDGCSSLGCKTCGGGNGFKLFHHRRRGVVGAPIESGAPMVIEQGAPGTVITPGSGASNVGDAEDNPMLAPVKSKNDSGSGGATGGSPSGAANLNRGHASNDLTLRSTPRRIASGPRALTQQSRSLPRKEPATGPARRNEISAADALLNDLPAPASEIGGDVSPPPAPEAGSTAPVPRVKAPASADPAAKVVPGAAKNDIKTPSDDLAAQTPAPLSVDLNESAVEPATIVKDAAIGAAPGMKRFKAVDLKLAGGSFPNADGLAWLAEKGYRTVLDLRDPADVRSGDLAAVNHQALRYVGLPVSETSLNVDSFKRFEAELALAGARPLYFFDADGSRAAALWYVKRIVVDLDDEAAARREVDEIGPLTPQFLKSAQAVVSQLKAARAARGVDPKRPQADAGKIIDDSKVTEVQLPGPSSSLYEVAMTSVAPATVETPPAPINRRDAWRTVLFILTVLAAPLAFWKGSSVVRAKSTARASLPGPRRNTRALPPSSGA